MAGKKAVVVGRSDIVVSRIPFLISLPLNGTHHDLTMHETLLFSGLPFLGYSCV
jgi:hypothetical protein